MATRTTQPRPIQAPKPVTRPITNRIHFADGNKGGVGKSFFARTLYQWFQDHTLPVIGLDTDIHTPDVASLGPAVTVTDLATEDARQLFETAVHQTTDAVVNLPPAVHTRLARWLGEVERWPVLTKHPVELIKWFVVSGEYDSATSLQASLETFGGKIPHVIVRNQNTPIGHFSMPSRQCRT